MVVVAVSLSGCVSSPVKKSSSSLKSDEVYALFAGKTVESVSKGSGLTSFTYYGPDGSVLQQRLWSKRMGKWQVKDNGKICLTFGKSSQCRKIRKVTEGLGLNVTYYKIRKRKGKKAEEVVRYRRFVDGNRLVSDGRDWPRGAELQP